MSDYPGKRFKQPRQNSEVTNKTSHATKRTPRFKQADEHVQNKQEQLIEEGLMQEATTSVVGFEQSEFTMPVFSSDEPIRIDPDVSGSFAKLSEGQGALVQDRENAASTTGSFKAQVPNRPTRGYTLKPRNITIRLQKRPLIAIVISALVVIALILVTFFNTFTKTPTSEVESKDIPERIATTADQEIVFQHNYFSLSKGKDGVYSLVSRPEQKGEGEVREYCRFEGVPVSLVLFDGYFLIPQNLPDGTWNVITYAVADGSLASQYKTKDGKEVGGKGKVASVKLENTKLIVGFEDGSTQTVELSR